MSRGVPQVHWRDTLSTPKGAQYIGGISVVYRGISSTPKGYHDECGGYHEYTGGY